MNDIVADGLERERARTTAQHCSGEPCVAISRFGARLAVLCKFVDAVLPRLTAEQCAQIVPSFREGVEDALSRIDDIAVSGEYQTTFIEQTNVLLTALEGRR